MRFCPGDGITLENVIVSSLTGQAKPNLATLVPNYPSFPTAPIPMKGGDGWEQNNLVKTQMRTKETEIATGSSSTGAAAACPTSCSMKFGHQAPLLDFSICKMHCFLGKLGLLTVPARGCHPKYTTASEP